jgi:hypothetical protein
MYKELAPRRSETMPESGRRRIAMNEARDLEPGRGRRTVDMKVVLNTCSAQDMTN